MKINGIFKTYSTNYVLRVGLTYAVVSVGIIPDDNAHMEKKLYSEVFVIQRNNEKIIRKVWFTVRSPIVNGLFEDENDFLNKEVLPRLNDYFNYKIISPVVEENSHISLNPNNSQFFQEIENHRLIDLKRLSFDVLNMIKDNTIVEELKNYIDFLNSFELPIIEYNEFE